MERSRSFIAIPPGATFYEGDKIVVGLSEGNKDADDAKNQLSV